jgi:hypothetical protein
MNEDEKPEVQLSSPALTGDSVSTKGMGMKILHMYISAENAPEKVTEHVAYRGRTWFRTRCSTILINAGNTTIDAGRMASFSVGMPSVGEILDTSPTQ